MRRRSPAMLLSCFLIVAVVLSACSSNGGAGEATDGTAATETAAPGGSDSSTSEAAPEEQAPEPVELRVLWWGTQDRHDLTMKAIELFEAKYPHITIVPEYSGFDGYWDKLSVQVSGGSAPDVIQMSYAYLSDYASRNALLELSDAGIALDTIEESTISAGKIGAELYAIPAGISSLTYVYDPAMLEKAGVTIGQERMTWEQFAAMAAQVSQSLGNGAFGIPDDTAAPNMLHYHMREKGYSLYKDGKIGYPQEALAAYLTYWNDLRNAGGTSSAEITASYFNGPLENYPIVQGKSPFALVSSNQYSSLSSIANRPLEMMMLPQTAGGKEAYYITPSMYWSINAKTPHAEEAALLVDFLLNDVEAGKVLSTNRGVPVASQVREAIKSQLSEQDVKMVEFTDASAQISQPIDIIAPPGAAEAEKLLLTLIQEMQFGQKTPEQVAAEFIEKGNQLLSQ